MLEFPGLILVSGAAGQDGGCVQVTPGPYGDCPVSSLLWRTLWKSYLFSWRTKLAKLLCLKCFGRMDLVNLSFYSNNELAQLVWMGTETKSPRARRSYLLRPPIGRLGSTRGPPTSCEHVQRFVERFSWATKRVILVQLSDLSRISQGMFAGWVGAGGDRRSHSNYLRQRRRRLDSHPS